MYNIETLGGISLANADCMEVMRDLPENAFALCKGLSKDAIGIEKRIQFGLDYVFNWAHYNGIDLAAYIEAKMRYNIMRPIRHGKKY